MHKVFYQANSTGAYVQITQMDNEGGTITETFLQ